MSHVKFWHGSKARGNKTKYINYSSLIVNVISYVSFPQATEPSINVIISKMASSSQEGGKRFF